MSSGGRPNHPIWAQGYKKLKEDKKTLALCTVCEKKIHNTSSSRLSMHRNVCKFLPNRNIPVETQNVASKILKSQQIKQKHATKISRVITETDTDTESNSIGSIRGEESEDEALLLDSEQNTNFDFTDKSNKANGGADDGDFEGLNQEFTSTCSSKSRPSTSNSLTSFVDTMSIQDINKGNELLGKLFFGCNIPFSVIESTHFHNFMQHMRPSYRIPSRKALCGKILDDIFNKFTKDIKFESDSVMLIDGWKNENANTKNVTVLLHSATGKAVFLDNWDLSEEKETGEKLTEIIEFAKTQAEQMYQTKIFAVVSDNAANMMKMGRLTDIIHLTCNSHTGQLLAKDILPTELATRVTSILKQFNGPDMEAQILRFGGSKISLPCETRWCSNRDSFSCFLKNLSYIKRVISENPQKSFAAHLTGLIFDQQFVKNVTEAVSLLDPICSLINKCQSSTASIACAAEAWLSIEFPPGFVEAKECLEKRRNYALKVPLLVANYLHPAYRGKKLNEQQIDLVNDYLLENLDATGLADLIKFSSNTGIFEILNSKEGLNLKPHLYWELASRKCTNLSHNAIKLLSIPASSAQLERVFSNWSYVHNKLRNRLSAERSKKLVKVYYSLKMQDSAKSCEY